MKRSIFSLLILLIISAIWYIGTNPSISFTKEVATDVSKFTDLPPIYDWALPSIEYFVNRGVLEGTDSKHFSPKDPVTREQLAKILTLVFKLPQTADDTQDYTDISRSRWSFGYIKAAKAIMGINDTKFEPTKKCTREEIIASIVLAKGLDENALQNEQILLRFSDSQDITPAMSKLVAVAVEQGLLYGADSKILPKKTITRAEAAVLLYRAVVTQSTDNTAGKTPIQGEAQATLEAAKNWAKSRGAAQNFIDIADIYWKYGELSGIRPEVMYAQSAKETAFGHYTGNVTPDMNNWAGIKTYDATGDTPADHEIFATADDGVRAHFNHMSAYIGTNPIGGVHPRYFKAISTEWAGKVRNVEELGGKWAPDLGYGNSIVSDYLIQMANF